MPSFITIEYGMNGSYIGNALVPVEDGETDAGVKAAWLTASGYAEIAEPAETLTAEDYRLEVERRIFAAASQNTQVNMAGAAAAGLFTALEMTAFQSGLAWINAMRLKGAQLAVAQDATYKDDSHWPTVPADAAALAALY